MNPDLMVVIERGRDAKVFVENPAFVATVNDLSAYYLGQIASCPIGEASLPALREAHLMHTALGEIVSHLQGLAAAGEQAEATLGEPDEDDI